MKTKQKRQKQKHLKQDPRRHLTLMAVQEKLGLFPKQVEPQEKQDHDYLKDKPLGLI